MGHFPPIAFLSWFVASVLLSVLSWAARRRTEPAKAGRAWAFVLAYWIVALSMWVAVVAFLLAHGQTAAVRSFTVGHALVLLFSRAPQGNGQSMSFGRWLVTALGLLIMSGAVSAAGDWIAHLEDRRQIREVVARASELAAPEESAPLRDPSVLPARDTSSAGGMAESQRNRLGFAHRFEQGAFESAVSGLRVAPVPGAALLAQEDLPALAIAGELAVQDQQKRFQIFVESIAAPRAEQGLRRFRLQEEGAHQISSATVLPGEPWTIEILGQPRSLGGVRGEQGTTRSAFFAHEGRVYRFSVEAPSDIPQLEALVRRAFQGISYLPSMSRAKWRSLVLPSADNQSRIGKDSVVRGRTFTSFRHGLSWTSPEGMWRALSEQSTQLLSPGAVFSFVDEDSSAQVTVLAWPIGGTEPRAAHDELVTKDGLFVGPRVVHEVRKGGQTFLVSDGLRRFDGVERAIGVAAWRSHDTTFVLTLETWPGTPAESSELLGRVLDGFSDTAPRSASEHVRASYVDHRLGYSFQEPPGWTYAATPSAAEGSISSADSWSQAGVGEIMISTEFSPLLFGDATTVVDNAFERLRGTIATSSTVPLTEERTEFAGRPARHLSLTDEGHHDWFVLVRGKVLFVLYAGGRSTDSLHLLGKGFALLP